MTVITNANLPVSNGSGDAALAHIQSNRVIGSTTIATDTISNWPANFIATTGTLLSSGFIDPTSKTDFYGHLGVGNQLIIDGFCPGNSDAGNTSGQVVVIKPNTEWANLIANGVQSTSNFPSIFANFVEPAAGIWSIVSGLAGTQTVGNVWYLGVRYSIPAVASNTFTASKDTYVDVNPATGAYTYVPVANGATEPAVTASCVRVARIITGASAITSIYQKRYQSPVAANSILASMLNLSNALAPESGVQSLANAGNAGGTMFYINLGGIKLLWGTTGTLTLSGTGQVFANFGVTFPTSFFSAIQSATATPNGTAAGTNNLTIGANTAAIASGWNIEVIQNSGTNGAVSFSYLVIGT